MLLRLGDFKIKRYGWELRSPHHLTRFQKQFKSNMKQMKKYNFRVTYPVEMIQWRNVVSRLQAAESYYKSLLHGDNSKVN